METSWCLQTYGGDGVTYLTSEVINLLTFLLPGFVTALIFYGVTSFPKRTEFDAVVVALVFTTIVRVLVSGLRDVLVQAGRFAQIGPWTANVQTLWSFVIAAVLGIVFAYLMNNDSIHAVLRKMRVTNQTSYPSEWYGTFSENKNYIVLHFTDGRRLYGWPREWPTNPASGHFVIAEPEWLILVPEKNEYERRIADEDLYVVVDAKLVEIVEFVRFPEEDTADVEKTTTIATSKKKRRQKRASN